MDISVLLSHRTGKEHLEKLAMASKVSGVRTVTPKEPSSSSSSSRTELRGRREKKFTKILRLFHCFVRGCRCVFQPFKFRFCSTGWIQDEQLTERVIEISEGGW